MKKLFTLAVATLLVSGAALAHEGDKKKCGTGKECCKKEAKSAKSCCKKENKEAKKETRPATKKA